MTTNTTAVPSLTVIVLTCNEARHLQRAIGSVAGLAGDIVIVDSGSTDATEAIAKAAGARFFTHQWLNYADQFQWALDHTDITTDWVMRLDADEVIEADLRVSLSTLLPGLATDVVGINLQRKHVFMGRFIRHGGRYPLILLRLWRRGHGRIEQRWMDEHIVVEGGRTITVDGGFADINLNDLTFFTGKHNAYATREALDVLAARYHLWQSDVGLIATSASRQASRKRWIKTRIYNRLPFGIGPLSYFLWRYFGQLGFLDGRAGLIYHFLQGFWYRFLVDAKVAELEMGIADAADNQERLRRLASLTGLKLSEHG